MPAVADVLTKPRWLALTAFAVALAVTFVLLGLWQLDRAGVRSAEDQAREAARSAPTAPWATLVDPADGVAANDEFRTVALRGRYLPDQTVLVRNRPADGQNGYLVLVPLQTADGTVLVARAWIPAGASAAAPDAVPIPPAGDITVTGRLRAPEDGTASPGLPAGQVERVTRDVLPGPAAWVEATAEDPPPAEPVRRLTAGQGWAWPVTSTLYAVQWFVFALIAVGGWALLLRRDLLDRTEHADERDVDGSGPR